MRAAATRCPAHPVLADCGDALPGMFSGGARSACVGNRARLPRGGAPPRARPAPYPRPARSRFAPGSGIGAMSRRVRNGIGRTNRRNRRYTVCRGGKSFGSIRQWQPPPARAIRGAEGRSQSQPGWVASRPRIRSDARRPRCAGRKARRQAPFGRLWTTLSITLCTTESAIRTIEDGDSYYRRCRIRTIEDGLPFNPLILLKKICRYN